MPKLVTKLRNIVTGQYASQTKVPKPGKVQQATIETK